MFQVQSHGRIDPLKMRKQYALENQHKLVNEAEAGCLAWMLWTCSIRHLWLLSGKCNREGKVSPIWVSPIRDALSLWHRRSDNLGAGERSAVAATRC